MSIATQLQRIKQAKEALKQAINAKGGTLTDEKLDAYAAAVEKLSGGSSEGYVAVEVDGVLKAQKLAFDGTEASASGDPEAIGTVGIFNTGVNEPEYKGVTIIKGTSAFYKCASVDSTAKTWTGYEAIQAEDGSWSFASVSTVNEWGLGYTPEVGSIYNENATVKIESLYGDFVVPSDYSLYIKDSAGTAVTGQTLNITGTPSYEILNGVPVIKIPSGSCIEARIDTSISDGDYYPDITVAFWYYGNDLSTTRAIFYSHNGNEAYENRFYLSEDTVACSSYPSSYTNTGLITHWCFVITGFSNTFTGLVKIYQNGILLGQGTPTSQYNYPIRNVIGLNKDKSALNIDSYYGGYRIYKRALTEDEVLALSREFIPVTD